MPNPAHDGSSDVYISVVIPARNCASTLGKQLRAILRQDFDGHFEVIVSVNGSNDDTLAIAEGFARADSRVLVVDCGPGAGINFGRNRGVQAAQGNVVAFCDADDEVQAGWLVALANEFRAGASLAAGALIRVSPGVAGSAGKRQLENPLARNDLGFLAWPTGANCAAARRVFDDIGYFDETFRGGGDETDFFWRAQLRGYELTYVPGAAVTYMERATLAELWRQKVAFGASHAALFERYRYAGMPRSSGFRSAARSLRSALAILCFPLDGSRVRRAVSNLAITYGRLRGSIKHRVLYL